MQKLLPSVLLLLIACGNPGARQEAPALGHDAPLPGQSVVDRPHVVFTVPTFAVQGLGAPVAPPVTTPSRPSRESMLSEDPGIVEVTASGDLVGVRPGVARVRSIAGSSSLLVTVVAPRALRLDPEYLELAPGGRARVRVLGEDGAELMGTAVRWSSADGVPLALGGGQVISMGAPGVFQVEARAGDAVGKLAVRVAVPASLHLRVSPPSARMRIGQVRVFQAISEQGGVRAAWSASDSTVLASIGEGLFEAKRRGRVKVCAQALDRTSCSDVEVAP